MDIDFNAAIKDMAILAAILIVLAYFVGATNLLSVGLTKGVGLFYAITGRNSQGNFANYPQGG